MNLQDFWEFVLLPLLLGVTGLLTGLLVCFSIFAFLLNWIVE